MAATYEIRLSTDRSERLLILGQSQWSSFTTTRVINGIGTLELVLPAGVIDPALYRRDYLVSILRSVDGAPPILLHDQVYFLRIVDLADDPNGIETDTLHGHDCNDLLRRRCIAYYTKSAQAEKTAPADNMIKAIVRENLGATASDYAGGAARGIAANVLVIDTDTSLGPSISRAFAWRGPMIDTLRDIADSSRQQGTYLAFDLTATPGAPLAFRTFIGQRGIDRRNQMIALSVETGTLTSPQIRFDYSDEKTAIYAGGQGEESDRIVQTAVDAARSGLSRYGRIEDFISSQGSTDATVLADARAQLVAKRPRISFTAQFTDSPAVQYGRDILFGDQVRAAYRGMTFDCRIDAVGVSVGSDGRETIDIQLRSETNL